MNGSNGEPAFPTTVYRSERGQEWQETAEGMTLRDYFAAKAMAGMLAYPGCELSGSHHNNNTHDGVASMAYEYADAMLRARDKGETP